MKRRYILHDAVPLWAAYIRETATPWCPHAGSSPRAKLLRITRTLEGHPVDWPAANSCYKAWDWLKQQGRANGFEPASDRIFRNVTHIFAHSPLKETRRCATPLRRSRSTKKPKTP